MGTDLWDGTRREPRPSSHDCSYFLRYGLLRELERLTDSGVVQSHIVARRAAPPTSFSTSLDRRGSVPSSAARHPTAKLRLSSDAGRRIHPTTTARLHQNSILVIVCSFLSSPSDDTSRGHGVRLGSQIRPDPTKILRGKDSDRERS